MLVWYFIFLNAEDDAMSGIDDVPTKLLANRVGFMDRVRTAIRVCSQAYKYPKAYCAWINALSVIARSS